jgi:hypothetical protein
MPRKLKAGGSIPYVLKEDREDAEPVTFQLKVLSALDSDTVAALSEQYQQSTSAADKNVAVECLLRETVLGWSLPDFSIENLYSTLTKRECWELVSEATLAATLTGDERKKYESQ